MPDIPKSILYIRPDTIGDLVIFSSALAQLQAAWPDARHTLLVRPGYQALAPLFDRRLLWHSVPINPFSQRPDEVRPELNQLLTELDGLAPDVIVAATLNRTWLEAVIAHHFPSARRVALGRHDVDPHFVATLKLELGIEAASAFNESVPVDDHARDWENNHRIVTHFLGQSTPKAYPALTIPADAATKADETLTKLGLTAGSFAAVFPAGLANVPIKAWPTASFAELVKWLQAELRMPVLLLGHESEKSILDEVASSVVALGEPRPALWLGRDDGLPLLAALLSQSSFYVGHDTGAMHIAAAVGRPTIGIFGGGHWPRFRPVGSAVVSVVQPLPCFGCGWDCRFNDAPCVKTIRPADVIRAVQALLARDHSPFDEVISVRNLSTESLRLIEAVTPRYQKLQDDRLDRQHRIEELKREANTKDDEIASLKNETNRKDDEIASLKGETDLKDAEIAGLKDAANVKDDEIVALKKSAEERKQEMEAIKAELEAECATKDGEISQLKAEADGKDTEITALKAVCNEREQLIFKQAGLITHFQNTVAHNKEIMEAQEREIAALRARIAQLEDILAKLPPDAPQWAQLFHDKDVHIGNLDHMIAERDREITTLRGSLENYASGFAGLEQVKLYSKLLAEKEAVIQVLNRACNEREKVIKDLASNAAGPFGAPYKLWSATKAHVRLKWWIPFNDWLFTKVVEDYWMQIGILQHYEPRPIVWDRFPKPRLNEARLPQIGIVTPSYGQAAYIESTILSVLNQKYPKLLYVVQDGKSKDSSLQVIERYADRLAHVESVSDRGQADAIRKGFLHIDGQLAPTDVMAWLNSDDFVAPRALRFVAEYFAKHPDVDVIYGHRIIIDGEDREVGRWIMPRHDPHTLEWIDYVPQETMFWRKRAWDRAGGIDPSFQFALDWDLLARFQQSGAKIVRVPYFLGCFRVHREQKTSQHIHTIGNDEMIRIRSRFHGSSHNDQETITRFANKTRFRGALTARLAAMGIRF